MQVADLAAVSATAPWTPQSLRGGSRERKVFATSERGSRVDRDGRLTWTNVPALVQRAVSKCPIRHGATAGTAAAGVGRMRKKLKLNRETLRRLDASRLVTVAGGLRSILPPPPIPTVDGFTCAGPCVTLTCLTHCDACGSLGCELA